MLGEPLGGSMRRPCQIVVAQAQRSCLSIVRRMVAVAELRDDEIWSGNTYLGTCPGPEVVSVTQVPGLTRSQMFRQRQEVCQQMYINMVGLTLRSVLSVCPGIVFRP